MKTHVLLFVLLFGIAVILPSCQEQELARQPLKSGDSVILRDGDECEDCDDMNDCCCFVELDNDNAATIHICGTSDGAGACVGST